MRLVSLEPKKSVRNGGAEEKGKGGRVETTLPLFSVRVLSLLTVFPAIYCYSNGIRGASPAKSPLLTLR